MKLTEWYPGDVKPVRAGVYQQMSGKMLGYQYWDGQCWSWWYPTIEEAFNQQAFGASSHHQNDTWRGIAGKPQ